MTTKRKASNTDGSKVGAVLLLLAAAVLTYEMGTASGEVGAPESPDFLP
jgi:hypothetical protein